jgi:NAD(P)H dehydrogenase (quinone)
VLGRNIEYQQVSFEDFRKLRTGEAPKPTTQRAAADGDRESAAKLAAGNDFLFQHLREVVIDHQNGVFAGTNDNVEKLGGRPPMTLEQFITQNRKAFE